MTLSSVWLTSLWIMCAMALVTWLTATVRHNAGLVDICWPLFFLAGALVHAAASSALQQRTLLVLVLVAIWSMRLAVYLAARNWNAPEDRRYRAIRERNDPGFRWKSIYLVFGLQALLAWFISAPLGAAIASTVPLGPLDLAGAVVVVFGIGFESLADAQLARFKSSAGNAKRVMDQGLWRYTRHPNYFGECCVWWGFYLVALGAGGWWSVFSPLLMTVLLLRVSGVALLEKDIGERRPAYRDYALRTNAFLPGRPREI